MIIKKEVFLKDFFFTILSESNLIHPHTTWQTQLHDNYSHKWPNEKGKELEKISGTCACIQELNYTRLYCLKKKT